MIHVILQCFNNRKEKKEEMTQTKTKDSNDNALVCNRKMRGDNKVKDP